MACVTDWDPPARRHSKPNDREKAVNSHVPARHRGYRTQRNSPYLTDSLAVTFHRSAAGMAWRWRTELTTLTL